MNGDDAILIRPISEADTEGFRQAVGIVGRERIYIRLTDAPDAEGALAFVRSNIQSGNPQFVAEHDGNIIGWCDIVREDYEAEQHCGSLGMGIIPDWRERGIGRQLIEAALRAASAAGFSRVELTVNADNERAIRLYESVGFVQEGRKRSARLLEGQFRDVLVMGRLGPPLSDKKEVAAAFEKT
jgi:RimJ/RimL family protein N-acetyltransferase